MRNFAILALLSAALFIPALAHADDDDDWRPRHHHHHHYYKGGYHDGPHHYRGHRHCKKRYRPVERIVYVEPYPHYYRPRPVYHHHYAPPPHFGLQVNFR